MQGLPITHSLYVDSNHLKNIHIALCITSCSAHVTIVSATWHESQPGDKPTPAAKSGWISAAIVRRWSYGRSDPLPNICTAGPSVGIDQTVFAVTEDTFLNLNTGAIWQLNNTQYITFNRSLDGTPAINYYGVGSSQTLLYVSPASFYSGGAGLDYLQIAPPAVSTPSNATSNSTQPVFVTTTQAWTKAVERLYYYTELVSLQAAVTTPCSNDSRYVCTYASTSEYIFHSLMT